MTSSPRQFWFMALLCTVRAAWAEPVQRPHLSVELVAEVEALSAAHARPFAVAIRYEIEKDWHVYWKNPGDSGKATSIQWRLPPGFQASPLEYPFPERIPVPPLTNYGFEGKVLLISEIAPASLVGRSQAQIEAHIEWLVCKQVCIPGEADLKLDLPIIASGKTYKEERYYREFDEFRSRIPKRTRVSGKASRNEKELELSVELPKNFRELLSSSDLDILPVDESLIKSSTLPRIEKINSGIRALFELEDQAPNLKHARFALGSHMQSRSIEFEVPLTVVKTTFRPIEDPRQSVESGGDLAPRASHSLIVMLMFAFIGGLILNVMPCVFPILSLKVLSFVKKSGQSHSEVRREGIIFSLGIVISFLVLAGALLIFRAAGDSIGWGFQLQNPAFTVSLAILFFLIGLNLLGVYEIGTRLMGLGAGARFEHPTLEAFFSGVLATLVATPCTAPFMGAALGFALAEPPIICLLIFTSLALGLAAPYLLFAFFPRWTRILPKPGAWMETLKQAFAFPIFATSLWLLWVFSLQTSGESLIVALGALLLIAFGAWLQKRLGSNKFAGPVFLICVSFAWTYAVHSSGKPPSHAPSPVVPEGWQPYSEMKIQEAQGAGRPVFVDFTAAWCVSCQVNKKVALQNASVLKAFAEKNVLLLRADWTKKDASIARKLQEYGRSGVPLYLLYPGRDGAKPQILPEILTPGLLLEKLRSL